MSLDRGQAMHLTYHSGSRLLHKPPTLSTGNSGSSSCHTCAVSSALSRPKLSVKVKLQAGGSRPFIECRLGLRQWSPTRQPGVARRSVQQRRALWSCQLEELHLMVQMCGLWP